MFYCMYTLRPTSNQTRVPTIVTIYLIRKSMVATIVTSRTYQISTLVIWFPALDLSSKMVSRSVSSLKMILFTK